MYKENLAVSAVIYYMEEEEEEESILMNYKIAVCIKCAHTGILIDINTYWHLVQVMSQDRKGLSTYCLMLFFYQQRVGTSQRCWCIRNSKATCQSWLTAAKVKCICILSTSVRYKSYIKDFGAAKFYHTFLSYYTITSFLNKLNKVFQTLRGL